ncbi:unnamed protein product [Rotaria socialis]|uniref:Uncharacterized protein n=1 Tax=Rotaria socialis TaxID=392032 RepID=A0A817TES6_9BILA|nr:unnamed protein product [Rotaria socialis]CAF4625781.1 unnamed protein product [Rotaria socialis]
MGLSTKYHEDENFRLNVKKLIALAFLPVPNVIADFYQIAGEFDDDSDDLLNYFEKPWIVAHQPKGRGRPKRQVPETRSLSDDSSSSTIRKATPTADNVPMLSASAYKRG